MPEEINRAVADLWCSPCTRARGSGRGIRDWISTASGPLSRGGFLEFLQLGARAWRRRTRAGQVGDAHSGRSGLTLRENTERPEIVDVGANVLAGTGSQRILDGARKMHGRGVVWKNPFGDGTAGKRIIQILGISTGQEKKESVQFSHFAGIRFFIRLPVPQWRCDDCHHLYK
jgi:hypothetical protein